MLELVDNHDLRSCAQKACGFESRPRHHVGKAKEWCMDEMPSAKFSGEETRILGRLCYENLPKIEFPSWVWDSHTKLGRELIKKNKADLRLDGRDGSMEKN